MSSQYSGRVTLIIAVILAALWAIFPAAPKVLLKPFKPGVEYSFRPDLKPGIDMVGGTSLLYEIKPPEGGYTQDLAERVMASLKKRVDPDGVRNLIWRPQGNTRLEVQMPLRPGTGPRWRRSGTWEPAPIRGRASARAPATSWRRSSRSRRSIADSLQRFQDARQ